MRILQVKDNVCGEEWAGVVRREDVRGTEKDRVVIAEGFRVGDFVRGVVVGIAFFGFLFWGGFFFKKKVSDLRSTKLMILHHF